MEEVKNNSNFEEYEQKARAIIKEYHDKMEEIRKQRPIHGRGEHPEEMIFRRERNKRLMKLAEEYRIEK